MPSIDETLVALQFYFNRVVELRRSLDEVLQSTLSKPQKDELQADIEGQINTYEARKARALSELIQYPPQHLRHFPKLADFHQMASYNQSVFIMTKFPEGNTPLDAELTRVITAVQDAVRANNRTPRLASERRYHPSLWDNVEVYLFGCQRGIAIVESKYKEELNPNVMMEWGWMRGMGKDVLYLVENEFDLGRADLTGLLQDNFPWGSPENAINNAIRRWLAP